MTIRLHIGETRIEFSAEGSGGAAGDVAVLPLGLRYLREAYFPRFPPSELQLESAIAEIEDCLMPLVPRLRQWGQAALASSDPVCAVIAETAGVAPPLPATVAIDGIERVFNRLAMVAAGRPARQEGIPEDTAFVAALLVLREIMHHAGYAALEVAR